jgi:hypothetical protein
LHHTQFCNHCHWSKSPPLNQADAVWILPQNIKSCDDDRLWATVPEDASLQTSKKPNLKFALLISRFSETPDWTGEPSMVDLTAAETSLSSPLAMTARHIVATLSLCQNPPRTLGVIEPFSEASGLQPSLECYSAPHSTLEEDLSILSGATARQT